VAKKLTWDHEIDFTDLENDDEGENFITGNLRYVLLEKPQKVELWTELRHG
jgi:hypothetical protein